MWSLHPSKRRPSQGRNNPRRQRQVVRKPSVEPLEERCVLDGSFGPWGTPVNLGPVVNSAANDQHPAISPDGLSLYITSDRTDLPGAQGGFDIWVSHRATINDPWGTPVNLGPTINGPGRDFSPAFSPDGHWMVYGRAPGADENGHDLYITHRADKHNDFGWETPVSLGPNVNVANYSDNGASLFEDPETGLLNLYFTSNRPGGLGDFDIYRSVRLEDGTFSPAEFVPEVSGPFRDVRMTIRGDGLEMILTATNPAYLPAPNPQAALDLWVSTRASTQDPWSTPVNLGLTVNSSSPTVADSAPYLSRDGKTLFFYSNRSGGSGGNDLYMTTREEADEGTVARAVSDAASALAPMALLAAPLHGASPMSGTAGDDQADSPASVPPKWAGLVSALGHSGAPAAASHTRPVTTSTAVLDRVFADYAGSPSADALADSLIPGRLG
jgi:WD40-like Beta Propeller Repeat